MCTHLSQASRKSVRQGGFTLVEVMVVSGIISIAAAIVVPNFLQWQGRYQLKQAMTELQRGMSLARVAAMNRNTTVTVTLDNNVVDPADSVPKVTATFTPAVLPPLRMPQAVTAVANITSPGTIPFNVRFSSLGVQLGTTQTLTLTSTNGLIFSAVVTPTGKAIWCPQSTCP